MFPILFKIGSIKVYSYGLMIAIGIVAALLLSLNRAKRLKLNTDAVMDLYIFGVAGGLIGAKLLYGIVELPTIINDPKFIIESLGSGLVVYGGIIGGIITGYIYCKRKKLDFWTYLDLLVPSLALAQGFGRIGCFGAGCCYGRETDSLLGVVFRNSFYAPNGVKLIPTQLFSSAGDFIIAGILLYFSTKSKRKGQVAGLYLILYSIGRFIVEMFRGDPRGNIGVLSTSQFICLFMFFIGIYIFGFVNKSGK